MGGVPTAGKEKISKAKTKVKLAWSWRATKDEVIIERGRRKKTQDNIRRAKKLIRLGDPPGKGCLLEKRKIQGKR